MTAPDHFADTFNKTLAGRERPHMTTPYIFILKILPYTHVLPT